jgi:dipeptidyl aminopeptidase/acylaminoacyl peptidase
MKSFFRIILPLLFPFISLSQTPVTKGNLVMEGIPDIPASLMEKMNQYQNVRSASFNDWTPDGKSILMSTRFGETSQIHQIDQPGGARRQITFFDEQVSSGTYCPVDTSATFFFTKDEGGNEFSQLFAFNTRSGNYAMVSDGGRSQNSLHKWSNKGDQFILVSTRRNGKDYDLYLSSVKDPANPKLILQEGGSWSARDFSPDDKTLIVSKNISANKSQIYLLDLTSLALTEINPFKEEISFGDCDWSADGKSIFIISDQEGEFKVLYHYEIATKKFTAITKDLPWDVGAVAMNKKRDKALFITNENGLSRVYSLDPLSKKYHLMEGLPEGMISSAKFNPVNNTIAFGISTAQSPGDIYTYNPQDKKLTRWTFSEVGGLNNDVFTVPSLVHYPTFDKVNGKTREIPAFYYKPKNVKGKMPVVINIHGGPESQFRPGFSSFISYMTNEMNIAVIAPNVRGSSGYGKSWLKADNGFLREESVKDIGALLDWIAKQPELDASRVCVYGGSYGGYMVLASMVHYNDRLRCGIDVVGISNFVTFLRNTEEYRRDLRRVEYGDERDPKMLEFLTKISPLNSADKISKPLFIIQGQNDPRVPASEAEQIKQKMQEKKSKVWYMLAKDEGHGFRKKTNVDMMQWAVVMFLQENLIN